MTDEAPTLVADLDGHLADAATPMLSPDDLGVLRGDGVFDVTLAIDGHPRDLDAHIERLERSAAMVDLSIPGPEAWRRGVAAVVGGWHHGSNMGLRMVATRGREHRSGPTCFVLGEPVAASSIRQRTEGVRAILLSRGMTGQDAASLRWLLAGAKTVSYAINMAARRHAEANGVDEAIFVDPDGHILEAPTASVVVAKDGQLTTPAVPGILDSITVRVLFAAAENEGWRCDTGPLTADDLLVADGVYLASSVRLLARVTEVDGRPLSGDAPDLLPLLLR